MTEAVLLACAGGLVGFAGGALLARKLGQTIFGSAIAVEPVLLPLILGLAVIWWRLQERGCDSSRSQV